MGSLLIVTGPPGAGKSTVAAALAARRSPSVLVAGDAFFGFLASGAIEPWRPESAEQNRVVTEAAGLATGRFARQYHTVFDGILGPWFLPTFARATNLDAIDYLILLPPLETCTDRVRTRTGHNFADEAATAKMHHEFLRAGIASRHQLVDTTTDASALAAMIAEAQTRGDLRYETPSQVPSR